MVFRMLQLGNFEEVLSDFIRRLSREPVEEDEWAMMAAANVSALLNYGRSSATARDGGRVILRGPSHALESDSNSGAARQQTEVFGPVALKLTCAMLSTALQLQIASHRLELNPYITIILRFFSTASHLLQRDVESTFEVQLPWPQLDRLVAMHPGISIPRQHSPPSSSEDSYVRGMQWAEETLKNESKTQGAGPRRERVATAAGRGLGWARVLDAVKVLRFHYRPWSG